MIDCRQPATIAMCLVVSASWKFFHMRRVGGDWNTRGEAWAHLPTWLGSCPCRSAGGGPLEGGGGGGGGEREEEGEWIWPAAVLAAALPQVGNPKLSLLLTYTSFKVQRGGIRSLMLPVAILGTWDMKFLACKQISLKIPQIWKVPLFLLTLTFMVQVGEITPSKNGVL